jgi:FdrA protein
MKRILIEPNRYFDSVFLMRISHELEQLPEVGQAIVAMGTRANLDRLKAVGFAIDEPSRTIHANDLVIAIDAASDDAIDAANERLRRLLTGTIEEEGGTTGESHPTTIPEAIEVEPDADLALISVPGAYAAREARRALRHGLHVMLFSDNVSVEDEIALKDEAIERGLLMMGPDCGTAILNGAPLGFANVVRRGSIGIVGASGTGIQEISSLVHRLGGGISQAIGTGGRDLSRAVGGRMTRFGIEALASDPETDVIVVVSKAPEPTVADRAVAALREAGKPAVVHFVTAGARKAEGGIEFASALAEAAELACAAAGIRPEAPLAGPIPARESVSGQAVGLFCGGTLAQEAWDVLHRAGLEVRSNVAAEPALKIRPGAEAAGHVVWDLGDDAFTAGKPHPMIAPSLRDDEVVRYANDPAVGIVLVDCVLGHGAHPDPGGSLADAAKRATELAGKDGRDLLVIASVTGTDGDPQSRSRQVATLDEAGVLVAPSNAAAAGWVVDALKGGDG